MRKQRDSQNLRKYEDVHSSREEGMDKVKGEDGKWMGEL